MSSQDMLNDAYVRIDQYQLLPIKETSILIWILALLLLFIIQISFVLISEYRRPQKAIAWLVILYLFPLVGFLLYYFIAKEYSRFYSLRRNDSKMLDDLKEQLTDRCKPKRTAEPGNQPAFSNDFLHAILNNGNSLPITNCNETNIYSDGEKAFEAMFESISSAKHHVHIEFYIIRNDAIGTKFQQLLIQKAQEGVQVRLLYDGIGSLHLKRIYFEQLRKAGVETGCFLPMLQGFLEKRINYRNHRKIVVVDGEVGFIGGLNIGDEYLGKNSDIGHWRDTHFRMKGDAVSWIQYTFAIDWYMVKRQLLIDPIYYPVQECQGNESIQIIKSGPDQPILELIFTFIVSAKKRIYIETPYLVPDDGILFALKTAAIRGVDVCIIIPADTDSKLVYYASLSYVRELQQAGIRFFRYMKGFIHAKVIISDDLACSGSANMDMRSFIGQFEINAVFFDGKVVDCLVQDFNRDLGDSEEFVVAEFEKQTFSQKSKEVFARLLSPLL